MELSRLSQQEIKRRAEARIWTQRDGTPISVSDMSDRHLLAAACLLQSEGFISPSILSFYLHGPRPNGDMAQDAFDDEFREVLESPVSPFVDYFAEEIKRRGLKL